MVAFTTAAATPSEKPPAREVASGCDVRLADAETPPAPEVVTLVGSVASSAVSPSAGPIQVATEVESVARTWAPETPMIVTCTAALAALGVLVPPAERLTEPAVTSARSSTKALIAPLVVASRSTNEMLMGESDTLVAVAVALAVRVAEIVAAPEPSVTVSL